MLPPAEIHNLSMSSPNQPNDKNGWGQLGNYAQLGFMLPAATVVGWLIGTALDHHDPDRADRGLGDGEAVRERGIDATTEDYTDYGLN